MNTRAIGLALAGLVAVSCFLPDVEFDPSVGKKAGAGSGGAGGTGAGTGGEAGADLSTQIELACTTYCDRYFDACEEEPANTYDNSDDCFFTCTTAGWPLRDPDNLNAPGTIECRSNHALLAATSGVDPHCFHSAEVPTKGVCEVMTP
jgi:hypothetical protein